jgi:hypothetical protein
VRQLNERTPVMAKSKKAVKKPAKKKSAKKKK